MVLIRARRTEFNLGSHTILKTWNVLKMPKILKTRKILKNMHSRSLSVDLAETFCNLTEINAGVGLFSNGLFVFSSFFLIVVVWNWFSMLLLFWLRGKYASIKTVNKSKFSNFLMIYYYQYLQLFNLLLYLINNILTIYNGNTFYSSESYLGRKS